MKTKNSILIFILLSVTINLKSQNDTDYNSDLPIFHEIMQSKGNSSLPYSTKGPASFLIVLDSILTTNYNADTSFIASKMYYKYDDNGNRIELVNINYSSVQTSAPKNYKYEYCFDEKGNIVKQTRYNLHLHTLNWIPVIEENINWLDPKTKEIYYSVYDTLNLGWNLYQKIEETYDDNGIVTSYILYNWEVSNDSWKYYSKTEQETDQIGNILKTEEFTYNENLAKWILMKVAEYNYENGHIIESVGQDWDYEANELTNKIKTEYTNDTNGKPIKMLGYLWDIETNQWKLSYDTEYSYNILGETISEKKLNINDDGNWVGTFKNNTYDEFGNLVLIENYDWDLASSDWVYYNKTEREFNDDGKITDEQNFKWDTALNDWIYYSGFEKEYNSNNRLIVEQNSNWNKALNERVYSEKKTYDYDIDGNKLMQKSYDWDKEVANWKLVYISEYFYSELTTNTDIILQSQPIKLYPNPANETLIIETQNPEITFGKLYDLNGKLLKNLTIQQGINSFVISDLKSGVYLFQIPQKEGMIVKKLVKN